MTKDQDLRSRLVVGAKRDDRREYDPQACQELVQLCMTSAFPRFDSACGDGYGLNPNVLREWSRAIALSEDTSGAELVLAQRELRAADRASLDAAPRPCGLTRPTCHHHLYRSFTVL